MSRPVPRARPGLPVSRDHQNVVAEEAEPAPVTGGVPTPAFSLWARPRQRRHLYGTYGLPHFLNFAVSWYANIGTSDTNVVGASRLPTDVHRGTPAKVVALEVDVQRARQPPIAAPLHCALRFGCTCRWSDIRGAGSRHLHLPCSGGGTSGGTCEYAPMNADGTPCVGPVHLLLLADRRGRDTRRTSGEFAATSPADRRHPGRDQRPHPRARGPALSLHRVDTVTGFPIHSSPQT